MINENKIRFSTGYVTIKPGDWEYPQYMSDVAARIIYDWKFDEECRRLTLNRSKFIKRKV